MRIRAAGSAPESRSRSASASQSPTRSPSLASSPATIAPVTSSTPRASPSTPTRSATRSRDAARTGRPSTIPGRASRVSREDVELVRRLVAPAEVDLVPVMRDDEIADAVEKEVAGLFAAEFECALVGVGEKRRRGFEGLREIWLDWLEPWATYRAEEERVV